MNYQSEKVILISGRRLGLEDVQRKMLRKNLTINRKRLIDRVSFQHHGIALCVGAYILGVGHIVQAVPRATKPVVPAVSKESKRPAKAAVPLESFRLVRKVIANETAAAISVPVSGEVSESISGMLVYTFAQGKSARNSFLHIRDLSQGKLLPNARTYEAIGEDLRDSGEELSSPVLSPNGRYIAFKLEQPWLIVNSYFLYVLDTETRKVKKVYNERLSYPFFSWSPDSNFLAFIEYGDYQGETFLGFDNYVGPLTLSVANWRTGQKYKVTENDTLGRFTWNSAGNLLYGMLPVEDQKVLVARQSGWDQKQHPKDTTKSVPRPNVYSFSPKTRVSTRLLKDAYQPLPSPDGKWVAFYGSEDPAKPTPLIGNWRYDAHGAALSVSKIDGSERVALDIEQKNYALLNWLPDNRRLLTVQLTQDSPESEAQVKEWDITTKRFRLVRTLKAKDFKAFPSSPLYPTFRPLGVSPDGRSLLVLVIQVTGKDTTNPQLNITRSIQAIDIKTGAVSTVVQTTNDTGIDWRFTVTGPQTR